MPRNVSGTYSLPLPPVVPNTVIQAAWANTTEDDIAQALTDSLDRNGRGGMTAPFRLINGSALQPAFAFSSETGTGVYLETPGVMAVAVMGAKVGQFSASGFSGNIFGNSTITGNLSVTGTATITGDVGIAGGMVLAGGMTSFDDITVDETFDGEAGFYVANHSGGTSSSAVFSAANNAGNRVMLAATGTAFLGLPALSATGMLYSSTSQGLALVTVGPGTRIRMMPLGTEVARFDSNGLGIGTTPATTGIHLDVIGTIRGQGGAGVAGSGVGLRLINSAGTGGGSVTAPETGGGGLVMSGDGGPLEFWAGGAKRLAISSTGMVTINTSTATSILSVGGSVNSQSGEFLITDATQGDVRLGFNAYTVTGMYNLWASTKGLTFGTASVERMRIDAAGLVGINGAVNPADLIRVGVYDAAKVPVLGFIKSGIQGWYVGGDKSGASNRFDISANGGPLLSINPGFGFVGIQAPTMSEFLTLGQYGDGIFKEMSVYGPYGSTAIGNFYCGMADGNGGGKVELNGHTSATTLSSWRMVHHSDIAGQDLTFRFAAASATRQPAASYAERFRVSSTGVASVTSGGNQYIVATDAGGAISGGSPPVGAIVHAVAAGAGFTAFTAGQAQALTGSITLTAAPIASGSNQVITSGVWRLLGASNTGTNTALWQRIG
jgi:hypothetical protein